MNTLLPKVQLKSNFEQALDKLDLQGCLLLLTVLSEKALYLQSKDLMDKKPILKPELIK